MRTPPSPAAEQLQFWKLGEKSRGCVITQLEIGTRSGARCQERAPDYRPIRGIQSMDGTGQRRRLSALCLLSSLTPTSAAAGQGLNSGRNIQIISARRALLIIACLLTLVLSAFNSWAAAETRSRWNAPALDEAELAAARWSCQRAWDLAWPLAKEGNDQARLLLLAIMTSNVNGPTYSQDQLDFARHRLVLGAYGALARPPDGRGDPAHRWIRNDIPNLIDQLGGLGPQGRQVSACYANGSPFRDCLKLAVSSGVIPTFEEYAKSVEVGVALNGKRASCRRVF